MAPPCSNQANTCHFSFPIVQPPNALSIPNFGSWYIFTCSTHNLGGGGVGVWGVWGGGEGNVVIMYSIAHTFPTNIKVRSIADLCSGLYSKSITRPWWRVVTIITKDTFSIWNYRVLPTDKYSPRNKVGIRQRRPRCRPVNLRGRWNVCRPQSSSSQKEKYLFLLISAATPRFVDETCENLLVGKIVLTFLIWYFLLRVAKFANGNRL